MKKIQKITRKYYINLFYLLMAYAVISVGIIQWLIWLYQSIGLHVLFTIGCVMMLLTFCLLTHLFIRMLLSKARQMNEQIEQETKKQIIKTLQDI